MKVIASYSIKGGVGKTATSVNLVYGFARAGLRTLLIDLDPQGASSFYFRIRAPEGLKPNKFFRGRSKLMRFVRGSDYDQLDVLPAKLAYRNFDILLDRERKSKRLLAKVLDTFRDHYDVTVLDTPACITLLSENVIDASDYVLVPVIPTTLSQRTYDQLQEFVDASKRAGKLLPFFSMVQSDNAHHNEMMQLMRTTDERFLKTTIPFASEVELMGERREPVQKYASRTPGGAAYTQLCDEVLQLVRAA